MRDKTKSVVALIGFVALCLITGMLASYFTAAGVRDWYPALIKSPLSPPNEIFAPVWSLLYTLMGVSCWYAWRNRHNGIFINAFIVFMVQLLLNFMWTFCFFYLRNATLGLIDIVLLDIALFIAILYFFKFSRIAAVLLLPYALWLLFATYLNAYIVWAN